MSEYEVKAKYEVGADKIKLNNKYREIPNFCENQSEIKAAVAKRAIKFRIMAVPINEVENSFVNIPITNG
jgi:hypothetical protein